MSIYDTMQFIARRQHHLYGTGGLCGGVLPTAGAKGKTVSLAELALAIHQPPGGYRGRATDIEIHAREIFESKGA